MNKIIFLLPIIFLMAGCTYITPKNETGDKNTNTNNTEESADAKAMVEKQEFNENGQAKAVENETDLWQLYSNEETSFSLKYPHNVSLSAPGGDLTLFITVKDLDTIEDEAPMGMGKENLLAVKESLLNNEYGNVIDWPLEESKQVHKVNGVNAQEFMVLGRFEVCDVTFERTVNFFLDNYFVTITLKAPRDEITKSMPGYFGQDSTNCGDMQIWNEGMQKVFYDNLNAGAGSKVALEWYNDFDKIIDTIEFAMPENINTQTQVFNEEELIGKWQSLDDEKYVVEFKNQEKTDYYDSEITSQTKYDINDDQLKVRINGEPLEYKITKLDNENLEMIYLGRGNILKFKKINQIENQ